MNGAPDFIEVTEATGEPRIVALRCICFIKKAADGSAVIEFTNDSPRLACRESYEDVRLTLLHAQPPDAIVNQR